MTKKIWLIYQHIGNFAAIKSEVVMKKGGSTARNSESERNATSENEFIDGIKDTLFFQLHRINLIIFRLANRHLSAANIPIKSEQVPVLVCIFNSGSRSQQEVADTINRDKSSVQRTVAALERKGLVKISPDKHDRRRHVLRATRRGSEVALKIQAIVKKVEADLLEVLDVEESLNNIRSLKAIADNLEQLHQIKH